MTPPNFVSSHALDRSALASEVADRRRRLREAMDRQGLDAVVVASEANVAYLTGYETTFFTNRSKPFAVVVTDTRTIAVCHVGEGPSVHLDAIEVEVAPYIGPRALQVEDTVQIDYQLDAADAVAGVLASTGASSVALELTWHFIPGFTPAAMDLLRSGLPTPARDASAALWTLRRVKSPWELDRMRSAADVADATHRYVAANIEIGMSEKDINRLLRQTAYQFGAEKIGYSGVIAGVDRAPLGGPTDRLLEAGQLVFVDICLQLEGGYFADFNRILAASEPDDAQRAAYDRVVQGLARGRQVARASATVADLAAAMIGGEDTIYARVGHGLGLEMPEPPSLSPMDATPLLDGEVLCIEPNTYVDGVGWLVSEEEVVIREDGFELLSPSFPVELAVIGGGA